MPVLERLKPYNASQTNTTNAVFNQNISVAAPLKAIQIESLNFTFTAAYTGTITITVKETADTNNRYNKTYTTSSLSGVTTAHVKGIGLYARAPCTINIASSANIGENESAYAEVLVEQTQNSTEQ